MPITTDSITLEQLSYLTHAVLSETVVNKDSPIPLGRRDYYLYNRLAKASKMQPSLDKGGVRINVKGLREQGYTWWDGTDILPFEEHYNGDAMRFYVGKGHFGDMLPHDFAERAGVKIDYSSGKGTNVSSDATTRLVNLLKDKADDINFARSRDLSKMIYKANSDKVKAFVGLMGLHPVLNPTYGDIGGLSRSNPLYQHYVDSTAWTVDNIQIRLPAMYDILTSQSNGINPNICVVGDNMYDLMQSLFSGSSSVAGKLDYRMAHERAMKAGEKYNIALPQDCFMYQEVMITRDATLRELHREDPSFGWANLFLLFNDETTYLIPVRKDVQIEHPVPYNQRVSFKSWHDELLLVSCMPNSFGIATTAYSGVSRPW